MNASALRGVVNGIDKVGVILLVDGGRESEAIDTKVADIGGNKGRANGAVGGFGVGFDVDDGFHIS